MKVIRSKKFTPGPACGWHVVDGEAILAVIEGEGATGYREAAPKNGMPGPGVTYFAAAATHSVEQPSCAPGTVPAAAADTSCGSIPAGIER